MQGVILSPLMVSRDFTVNRQHARCERLWTNAKKNIIGARLARCRSIELTLKPDKLRLG